MSSVRKRAGFTLLEITIVLILIVGLMSIAWPRLRAASRRSDLRDAAMAVKTSLAAARDQSVRSGQQVHFVYKNETSQFQVGAALPADNDTMSIGVVEKDDQKAAPESISGALPGETMFFFDENATEDEDDELHSVTFFPDGRSTQSMIRLALTDRTNSIDLSVRGLTGGVTIHPIQRITQQDAPSLNQER